MLHIVVLLLAIPLRARAGSLHTRGATFDWSTINASTELSWTPCYDTFQCSKLTVPLQYSNRSAGEAQIAVLMSPSNYSSGDPNYLGPMLFNPGGPGGAGTSYVVTNDAYFRQVIGPQYDLVGFDPRGIGASTPPLALFHSPPEALEFYLNYPLNVNESDADFGRFYAQAQILGMLAVDRYELVAESVGTAAVATDMLQIARAFGHEEVNYWGVSYGSVLGSTFAAMFPDNVGKFIVDGNWSASLTLTDAALSTVYTACVTAGPTACALYEPTPAGVQARLDALLTSARATPHVVYNNTDPSNTLFGTVDAPLLVLQLFQMLYEPVSSAAALFSALHALEQGDAQPVFAGSVQAANDRLATCDFDANAPFVTGFLDTAGPIACGDVSPPARVATIDEARDGYEAMLARSRFAGTWYPLSEGRCAGWNISAADQLNGTFTTSTSTPILFISNTYDPVTPISGGRTMSSGFAGSVILTQNSTGHTSLSAPSACTADVIRKYVVDGTLPVEGTVCEPDEVMFGMDTTGLELRGERRVSRVDMGEVLRELKRARP
ncbi:hypothetical protein PHLGIDRAFT_117972 [Phlebiopsis gigantea 11061_1 CR5-6]|uniref:AB hydrolase-1 domain-containing protein n=1 Tax=Phlebiopsis gigantea (strain 11061_1 CR5-6) TaxID=745531 RepID=A0A0C3RZ59_PHLG1|nr:hypothetical protein PHLGIDRAFT_117972 [Phlebiopsis gigantea 11061_1 CR5-6]